MKQLTITLFYLIICCSALAQERLLSSRSTLSVAAVVSNAGPGCEMSYEMDLGKTRKLAIIAPASFCFGYAPRHDSHGGAGHNRRPLMVMIAPGVLFYPTGSDGAVRYSLGGQLVAGAGKGKSGSFKDGTDQLQARSIFGLMVSNAINFQIAGHLRTAVIVGTGVCADNGFDASGGPYGQLSLVAGWRF